MICVSRNVPPFPLTAFIINQSVLNMTSNHYLIVSKTKMKQPTSWQPVSRIKWRHDVILGRDIMTLFLCTKRSLFYQEDHLISRISYSRDNNSMTHRFQKHHNLTLKLRFFVQWDEALGCACFHILCSLSALSPIFMQFSGKFGRIITPFGAPNRNPEHAAD